MKRLGLCLSGLILFWAAAPLQAEDATPPSDAAPGATESASSESAPTPPPSDATAPEATAPAPAATPEPEPEEVVVTAKRIKEEPFQSERSVDVVSRRELDDRTPRTAPEALRESPGVFVQQTNTGGGSPIIRGLVGPQVLLRMDGVRLNNSTFRTGPVQYMNFLDTYLIDRMDVVRGPGSVLYGSDALGGTIHAVYHSPADRRGQEGFGYNASLAGRYGSAAREKTLHAHADMGYSLFGFRGDLTLRDFGDLEGGRGVGVQPYSSYSTLSGGLKLMTRLDEGFTKDWTFTLAYYPTRFLDVGRAEALQKKHNYNIYQNSHDLVYARGKLLFKPIATDLELTLSYQRFFERKDSHKLNDDHSLETSLSREDVHVNTVGLDAQFDTRLWGERLVLVYGLEYTHDFVDSSRRNRATDGLWSTGAVPPYPDGSEYYLAAGYVLIQGELFPSDWSAGLRLFAGYRLQGMGGHGKATEEIPATDFDNVANIFTAGISTHYEEIWMAAFTWSQGVRAPNLQESLHLGDTGDWFNAPNPDLGPERADTIECLTRFKAGPAFGGVAGYVTFLRDFIKRTPTTYHDLDNIGGNDVVHNVNGGRARVYGLEVQAGVALPYGFTLSSSLTATYGVEFLDERDDRGRKSVPLSKIPPLFGDARLRWDTRFQPQIQFFAETFILYAAKQTRLSPLDEADVRIPQGGTPGWITWNARAGLEFRRQIRLTLNLENLTDTRYKYHASGIYGAGTNAVLGLEFRM